MWRIYEKLFITIVIFFYQKRTQNLNVYIQHIIIYEHNNIQHYFNSTHLYTFLLISCFMLISIHNFIVDTHLTLHRNNNNNNNNNIIYFGFTPTLNRPLTLSLINTPRCLYSKTINIYFLYILLVVKHYYIICSFLNKMSHNFGVSSCGYLFNQKRLKSGNGISVNTSTRVDFIFHNWDAREALFSALLYCVMSFHILAILDIRLTTL